MKSLDRNPQSQNVTEDTEGARGNEHEKLPGGQEWGPNPRYLD
jgi:hypothetical protein